MAGVYKPTEKVSGERQQHQGEGKQEAKQKKMPMSNIKAGAGEGLKLAGAIDQTQGCVPKMGRVVPAGSRNDS